MKIMLFKFLTIGAFGEGGIRDHNPPENWVLQNFKEVFSLNIRDTELDTVGT